jgi:hypothetical protein
MRSFSQGFSEILEDFMIILTKEDVEAINMIRRGVLTYRRGLFSDPRVANFVEDIWGWK